MTGAARGQGRSHAIRLAQEGADIIAVDICAPMASVPYALATPEDLEQTMEEVEAIDRRIMARKADVRDVAALREAFEENSRTWNARHRPANAGIGVGALESAEQTWEDALSVNLTGVWNTGRIAIPGMIEANKGGAIVLTSSTGGRIGPGSNEPGL
jgi:NAD(P)-dependent dehydrogenase (short-subunit alcohol dehydrogenase family)